MIKNLRTKHTYWCVLGAPGLPGPNGIPGSSGSPGSKVKMKWFL